MIYEISRDEESSNECSQCQREQDEEGSHAHHHDETSSEEQGAEVESRSQPLQPQKSILLHLQQQISELKRSNIEKDRAIKQLRYELEARSKQHIDSAFAHKTASIKKQLEKESIASPKAVLTRLYSPELRPKTKGLPETESALQIALLEKQVKELQLRVLQLSNKLTEYEESFSWMEKFIVSFVQMAEDLSVTYGGQLALKGLPLRKKTKTSWKYMKELINYLIK